jgi:hypothetical protein
VLTAVALSAHPLVANAGADTVVQLDYQADEQGSCVGEDELRGMVTRQLGRDPFRTDAERRVAITITRTEVGFQGRIVWTEADGRQVGQRLLSSRSRDCHEIAANVAFAVALQLQLIDRGETADATVPNAEPPAPTATDETKSVPTKPESLSAKNPAAPPEAGPGRLVLAVGAGPALGLGLAPEATAFGRLFVAARFRWLSAEIAADASLPVTQREPDGAGVVVSAIGASAAGCGHLSIIAACALGRIGWIRAAGTGVNAPLTSWARFEEAGIRLAGSRDFGRVTLSVHADGLVMLSRWNVVLNDVVVWSVPRLGAVVGLDVALRFF